MTAPAHAAGNEFRTKDAISLAVTIVKANGLSVTSRLKRKPNAFVQVKVGSSPPVCTRTIARSTTPTWNQRLSFTETEIFANIDFEVIDDGIASIGPKKTLGRTQETSVEKLLDNPSRDITLNLIPNGSITVLVERQTTESALMEVDQAVDKLPAVSESLGNIVESLGKLIGMVDSFTKIHPLLRTTWKVVDSVYQIVKEQLDRDTKITGLAKKMKMLYSFVSPLEALNEGDLHDSIESVIQLILKQTIECASFIREYAGHGFAGRATEAFFSSVDKKIGEFSDTFVELASALDTGLGLQTTFVSLRIQSRVEEMVLGQRLDPVVYNWDGRLRCQPDTRLDAIEFVNNWVFDASGGSTNILWLHGLAGSGKSTLATSIADFFAELNRLGAFIFFDRDMKEKNQPLTVVRTLACELSRFDKRIHDAVIQATDNYTHISRMQLDAQFRELLVLPLQKSAGTLLQEGPIVIIIDALDECGAEGDRDRERLLSLLATEAARLPPSIRIIITSRDEHDIKNAFREPYKPHILPHELKTTNEEISRYIRQQMSEIGRRNNLSPNWPDDNKLSALVERAAGLFIWASTACKYVDEYDAEDLLDELVTGHIYDGAEEALDVLYVRALKSIGNWSKPGFRKDSCAIIGLILVAKTPVSPDTIDRFLKLKSLRIIPKLGSVLYHQGNAGAVRILHASFRDCLTNRMRCKDRCEEKCSPECSGRCKDGPWFIDLAEHTGRLIQNCINSLSDTFGDKFCHLSINDPRDNVMLDEATVYACTYWVSHVCELQTCPEGFGQELFDFLKKHLLHWLEAMSMLERSRSCANLLEQLHVWVVNLVPEINDLHKLVYDGSRFAGFFSSTIAKHPAYVYSSALPFAPVESLLYELFHTSSLPTILGGYQRKWSQSLQVFERLDTAVHYLAFSPDDTKILSSGGPGGEELSLPSLRVWNASTGLEALPVQNIDDGSVVAFSRDGLRMLSASRKGTVMILDAATGKLLLQLPQEEWASPNQIHRSDEHRKPSWHSTSLDSMKRGMTAEALVDLPPNSENADVLKQIQVQRKFLAQPDWDDSVQPKPMLVRKYLEFNRAAFSPNGEVVVFGAEEGEICVVNLTTQRQMYPTLQSHELKSRDVQRMFRSIDFSPDGAKFTCGSKVGAIEVRETSTGKVLMTLEGHTEEVTVLKYIGDDCIISSAEDGTIRMWNPVTGEETHLASVEQEYYQPLGIDPEGQMVVSTSQNGTMRVWDVVSGKEMAVLQGHFNAASAIAFSNNNTRMVSGAFLNNIQVWDVPSFREISLKIQRHVRPPHDIKLSSDGFRIRSSRPDSTKYWDTITGRELEMDGDHWDATFNVDDSADVTLVIDGNEDSMAQMMPVLYAESKEEWHQPIESDSPWVSAVSSAAALQDEIAIYSSENEGGRDAETFINLIKKDGDEDINIWRLPLEFRCRSYDHRGNFVTFGIWNGRVFTVYLPKEVIDQAQRVRGMGLTAPRRSAPGTVFLSRDRAVIDNPPFFLLHKPAVDTPYSYGPPPPSAYLSPPPRASHPSIELPDLLPLC